MLTHKDISEVVRHVPFKMAALRSVRLMPLRGSTVSVAIAEFDLNNGDDRVSLVLRPYGEDWRKLLCAAFFNSARELICALDLSGENDYIPLYIHPRLLENRDIRLSDDSVILRSFALRFLEYYRHVASVVAPGMSDEMCRLGVIDQAVDQRRVPLMNSEREQALATGSLRHVKDHTMLGVPLLFLINNLGR